MLHSLGVHFGSDTTTLSTRMNLNSIGTAAATLCLLLCSVGTLAVTTAAPTSGYAAGSTQDTDAARRELEQTKAELQDEREARTAAEAGRDEARGGSRVFLSLALLLGALLVATAALLVSSIKSKRPKWLQDLLADGGEQPSSAPDADKARRAAQVKLDEWLSALAKELEVNPGSDAAEEALDHDRRALRRAGEPGLGSTPHHQGPTVNPASVGAPLPRPTAPLGQAPATAVGAAARSPEQHGGDQVREFTSLIMRLAAAAQQPIDSVNHTSRLQAATDLLNVVRGPARGRSGKVEERRGPEAAACMELARAAVELAQGWAFNGKLDQAKAISQSASALFADALSWLPDKDDVHVHVEKAQLNVVRALMETDESQRLARLGEALSEVHSAQRKNRLVSPTVGTTMTAGSRVDDLRVESRLEELALTIRLDGLGVPSLKELSRSDFRPGNAANLRVESVLPLSVAEPESGTAAGRTPAVNEKSLTLDLQQVAAWATQIANPASSYDVARPMLTTPAPASSGRSMAWNVLRLRLELCIVHGAGGATVATFNQPTMAGWADETLMGGFGLGASHADYKQSLFDAVEPSNPDDPRQTGVNHADLVALRHYRLLRLATPHGFATSTPAAPLAWAPGGLQPTYQTAVSYFASLVKCRKEGRAAPAVDVLKDIWEKYLDAGLNERTGLFEGRLGNEAESSRNGFTDFVAQYWLGHCFFKAATPPTPPDVQVGDRAATQQPEVSAVSCVLLPIRGKDAAGKDVVRGLKLVDLSTAYRQGDNLAKLREEARRDRIKQAYLGRRISVKTGGPAPQPVRRKGIFGLELSAYEVEAQISEVEVDLDGGARVNCLQLAELKFDMVDPIDGGVPLRVEVLSAAFHDGQGWHALLANAAAHAEGHVLCECEQPTRPFAIVPECSPLRVAPWGSEQLVEVLPFYTNLLMYMAGDLDQSSIRSELSAALRSLHEQFGTARDAHPDLKFDDQSIGFVSYQSMRMARWRYRKQGIEREWQWILALMPAAVEPFIRLLQLDGNQTLLGVAQRNGIKAPDQPVQVSIHQPLPGGVYREGAAVALQASAKAMDGANLSASIRWSSRSQGELGAGASLSISTLRAGRHSLVATAVDASGRQGVAEVSIDVGDVGWNAQPRNPAVPPVGMQGPRQVGGSLPQRVAEYYGLAGSFMAPPAWSSPPTPQQRKHLEGLVRSAQNQLQADPSAFELGRQLLAEIARASA